MSLRSTRPSSATKICCRAPAPRRPSFTSREIERDNALFIPWLLSSRPKAIIVHSRKPKDLSPRPEYGFYPALVKAEPFIANYTLARVFGAPGDDFHYWIYFRR